MPVSRCYFELAVAVAAAVVCDGADRVCIDICGTHCPSVEQASESTSKGENSMAVN